MQSANFFGTRACAAFKLKLNVNWRLRVCLFDRWRRTTCTACTACLFDWFLFLPSQNALFPKQLHSFSLPDDFVTTKSRACDSRWWRAFQGVGGGFSTDYIAAGQVSTLLCLYHFSDLPLTTVFAVLRLVMKPLTANYRGDHLIMFKLIQAWGFGLVLFAYPYISSLSPVRWWSVLSPLHFPSLAN